MLTMGDGPVSNLPAGLDAYAGYVDQSGIGKTFVAVVAKFPDAHHLSIATHGAAALCADVESGAMRSWAGYTYGYCEVSMVNTLVRAYGRPRKLWTAHRDPRLGSHICSPACWPGLITTADGTQWTNHGGAWDESVLLDDFFVLDTPNPIPIDFPEGEIMQSTLVTIGTETFVLTNVIADGHAVQVRQTLDSIGEPSTSANTSIIDLTDAWPTELSKVTG